MWKNCRQPLAPSICGGLVELVRDRLHRRQVDQRVVARPAPGRPSSRARTTTRASRLPVDRCRCRSRQHVVDEAVAVVEELREDQRDGDERGDLRQEQAHPEEGAHPQLAVQEVGEHEREQELRHRREHPDPERVLDRVPEVRVVAERRVVREADELRSTGRAGCGRAARPTPCRAAGRRRRPRRAGRTARRRGTARPSCRAREPLAKRRACRARWPDAAMFIAFAIDAYRAVNSGDGGRGRPERDPAGPRDRSRRRSGRDVRDVLEELRPGLPRRTASSARPAGSRS